ncbi:MAG: GTP cyclohydrolase 1 [Chlamydiales bacterium]|nr:GTP cyclohydrolase 1 [Chlamydiales bacterium]MCH9635442.1 GTP cyclohydrolase 1 [Chlamydiales bacterium]MCH9703623.1 GTP cyclohydrolase I [Chlamydiota bacterium]
MEERLEEILEELGLELPGTAKRLIDFYKELATAPPFPKISLFEAPSNRKVTIEGISFVSYCEHHLLPFFGRVTLSYCPREWIMGLSNLHEIVHHFSKRPQLQERLTQEIGNCLVEQLKTDEVWVEIRAQHGCVMARGSLDQGSEIVTLFYPQEAESHSRDWPRCTQPQQIERKQRQLT